jgi:hypothetical protein
MKPLFTVHAGEYVVGNYIEQHYRNVNLWLPAKDTGIDLLASDALNKKTISLQIKSSRDFNVTDPKRQYSPSVVGWWSLARRKIADSRADYWVFVIVGSGAKANDFVIVKPSELLVRLHTIHGRAKTADRIQTYLWIRKHGTDRTCWETRGLTEKDKDSIEAGNFVNSARNFTEYLDGWKPIERLNNGGSSIDR